MLTPKPPSKRTFLVKFLPTLICITTIQWLLSIATIVDSNEKGCDGIGLKMYLLMLGITCNNCLKFNVYLVSKLVHKMFRFENVY
jgi:hypothetical protein